MRKLNDFFVGKHEVVPQTKSYYWLRFLTLWLFLVVIFLIMVPAAELLTGRGSGWEWSVVYWSLFFNIMSLYKWFNKKTYAWERL
jgi:hypothetical protein